MKKNFVLITALMAVLILSGCAPKCKNLKTEEECKKGPDCIVHYVRCDKGSFGCNESNARFESCRSKE